MKYLYIITILYFMTVPTYGFLDTLIDSAIGAMDEVGQLAQLAKTLNDLNVITKEQNKAIQEIKGVYEDQVTGEYYKDKLDNIVDYETKDKIRNVRKANYQVNDLIGFDIIEWSSNSISKIYDKVFYSEQEDIIELSESAKEDIDSVNKQRELVETLNDEGKTNLNTELIAKTLLNTIESTDIQRSIANDIKKIHQITLQNEIQSQLEDEATRINTHSEKFHAMVFEVFR